MATNPNTNLAESLAHLNTKDKEPNSVRILNTWIAQAESKIGSDGGRLGWLVASTVVTACLQQAIDTSGTPLFVMKGGSLLQNRLPKVSRATTDLDGLIRGDIDEFLGTLDQVLQEPWGAITLQREAVEIINVPTKIIKPRRFYVVLSLKGVIWRRIQVEVSPNEGNAGNEPELLVPPSLDRFGLPTPDYLVGLAMSYQIAQKVHAATEPHNPPANVNDRARDVVDLLMLSELVEQEGAPSPLEIKEAITDIFAARAADAKILGLPVRNWPTRLIAYPHWQTSYKKAAHSAGVNIGLNDAVATVNAWLDCIAADKTITS